MRTVEQASIRKRIVNILSLFTATGILLCCALMPAGASETCPGSKIGNAAYTVRDYVQGITKFRIRPSQFPPENTTVRLIFRLQK